MAGTAFQYQGVAMKRGDVLLKHAKQTASVGDFFVHGLIKIGQKLGRGNKTPGGSTSIAHGAIALGDVGGVPDIAEAVGGGLQRALFRTTGHQYRWDVWRFHGDWDLRHLAADLAAAMVERKEAVGGYGSYNFKGLPGAALTSAAPSQARDQAITTDMTGYLDNLHAHNGLARESFFCTEFVTFVYTLAAQFKGTHYSRAIHLDYRKASPSDLDGIFKSSNGRWTLQGTIVGST
jgi:hypothetical protein